MSRESRIARALRTAEGESYKPVQAMSPAEVAARFSWTPSEEEVLQATLLEARKAGDYALVGETTRKLNALYR